MFFDLVQKNSRTKGYFAIWSLSSFVIIFKNSKSLKQEDDLTTGKKGHFCRVIKIVKLLTAETLYENLNYVSHSLENRRNYANLIIAAPQLIPKLLEILFMVDDKTSCRAAWVLEFMCHDHLDLLAQHLGTFTENIHKVHLDPAVRPVAKICELLATAYYSKESNTIKAELTRKRQERIIETCFDWMINDEKIAPKAYSMNTLYLFGQDFDWIRPELAQILERDFQMQSSGFKARARHILKKIKS